MRHSREADQAAGLMAVRRALEGRAVPALCAVAVKADKPVIWTRFLFDVEPTDAEQDLVEAAGEAVAAGLPGRWLSQVLLRSVAPGDALTLEPGEEWAWSRTPTGAAEVLGGD